MIEILREKIPEIHASVRDIALGKKPVTEWGSLVINRRKPHTYRVFRQFGEHRVCLHRFEPCSEDEAFPHPHPWPGAFLLLQGEYVHTVGGSADLESKPEFYIREIVRPYSMYEIINPKTWHRVQPLKTTYTVMLNSEPWDEQHNETRTTKGKDLDNMDEDSLFKHFVHFENMLHLYKAKHP